MTIAPGLCSVTFRSSSADAVLELAARAGVEGIEWGSDVHAPPGGGPAIDALAARTRDAGLEVVSYGSYLGMAPADGDDASTVDAALDSAEALGAPMVRIWTELGVTPASPPADRGRVIERTAALVDRITGRGLLATLEFHPATLTEVAASANQLLEALARPGLRTHWQPDPALSVDAALAELTAVTHHLAHLHTFAWGPAGIEDRRPLSEGAALWTAALALADHDGADLPGRRYALCEYVRGDEPEQLVADVRVLRRWLHDLGGPHD
jgi:sugar phosphate isomerase/epimerase